MPPQSQLRTGVWHGDVPLHLEFPAEWDVRILWPRTPPPLTDNQIREALERPVGQPPLRELCRGKSRPLVVVDDLNRPTPADRIMAFVLRQLAEAGIPARHVTILVAGGTHGRSTGDAPRKKVGSLAADSCRLVVHDPVRHGVKVGRTSFGTPIRVNPEVVSSDFVLGIGGVYPNQTAGFGGGTKLALGVLDLCAISFLHHRHASAGWGVPALEADFRRDLDETARRIGLLTMISAQVDADRQLIRVACGDPLLYYPQEVAFARQTFCAPLPGDADVVIANAYPNDLSFTFVWMKSLAALRRCAPGASRIVVASCCEGAGAHGVYPVLHAPRFHRERDFMRRVSVMGPAQIVRKAAGRLTRALGNQPKPASGARAAAGRPRPKHPIWMFRPGNHSEPLPQTIREVRVRSSWEEVLRAVRNEQGDRVGLKVLVYPCAPLQCLEEPASEDEQVLRGIEEAEGVAIE